MRKPVDRLAPFLFYTRPVMFNESRFAQGHSLVYSAKDMALFDSAAEKQLVFNFSQWRISAKKQVAAGRVSCLAVLDLNHNNAVHCVATTDF